MINAINIFIELGPKLSKEERNILSAGYKSILSDKRDNWKFLNNMERKEFKKKSKQKPKIFNDNINFKNFLDLSRKGKSVFLKISEDTFTKLKSKPNKEVRDINKTEEDAYNKMTSEPYIRTCENKENINNKKIEQQYLDRKAKEDIFKDLSCKK